MEINLKSQLSSILVAKMALPEITYMEVATTLVKKASRDLKTMCTKKDNDSLSVSPITVPQATIHLWILKSFKSTFILSLSFNHFLGVIWPERIQVSL